MKTLIDLVQEEINQLMQSKMAKFSDAKLECYDKKTISLTEAKKMHHDYVENKMTMRQLSQKYPYTIHGILSAFERYKLKTRVLIPYEERVDELKDIKNGMKLHEFISKYNTNREFYYKLKSHFKKTQGEYIKKRKSYSKEVVENMILDIKQGLTYSNFISKYSCGSSTYCRLKEKVEKDLAV